MEDNYAPGTANDPNAPWNQIDIPTKECPDCLGYDGPPQSNCCGARIDSDHLICFDCKEHADIQVCETCDGEGVVDDDDAQDS